MNILEEFWYGNIEPAEYDISSSKEYKELLQLISRNEDKLLATMTDDQKELFTKYADCVREYQVMAECLLFQNSFRLGGRMMLEVMNSIICRYMGVVSSLLIMISILSPMLVCLTKITKYQSQMLK